MQLSRVKKTMLANLYAQGVTLVIALASVPAFLSVWSLDEYGAWLLIYTLPACIVAADFGIGTASSNKMVLEKSTAAPAKINLIFGTSVRAILMISIAISALATLAAVLAWHLTSLERDIILAGYLLVLLSAVSLFNPSIDGAMRFHGLYWQSVALLNTLRLVEWLGAMIAIILAPTLTSAAAGMLTARVTGNLLSILLIASRHTTPRWSLKTFSRDEFREILRPAIAFSLFPIANAISIQGLIVVVGYLLNPTAVVLFSTYRTITRTVTQLLAMINKSYWSEISEAYGKSDNTHLIKLTSDCRKLSIITGIVLTLTLSVTGRYLVEFWTNGKVPFDVTLFLPMISAVLVTGFWQSDWVFLMATNNHQRISILFLWTAVLTTVLAGLLVNFTGLIGAILMTIAFEIVILFFARSEARRHF